MTNFTKPTPDDSMATRRTMLSRLGDRSDDATWGEFYRRYRPLVYGFALKLLLSPVEAEEVCMDVFNEVSMKIVDFDKDRGRGSFRSWLFQRTEWRVKDKLRKRQRHQVIPIEIPSNDSSTDLMSQIPVVADLEQVWEGEWVQYRVATALRELAKKVPTKQYQAFELHTLHEWPVNRVAKAMGMNAATVYVNTHRLRKLLKIELERVPEDP